MMEPENGRKMTRPSLNGLLNGLDPDTKNGLLGLVGDIPFEELKAIIRAAGLYESPVRMRLLYALAEKEKRTDYPELVRRARILDWNLEGLRAWIAADRENIPAETVERLIRAKVKPLLRTWLHHHKLETALGGKITADEAHLAKKAGGSKLARQAWTLRMARLLLKTGYTSNNAWILAGILARTQSVRNRRRLLTAGGGFLKRTLKRQPKLLEELVRRLAPKGTAEETDEDEEPKKDKTPPVYDGTLKTAHVLLDIGNHLPPDIDLEHAQAIIVHGHLMPGQRDVFVGEKYHQLRDVRENVRNKLGRRFRDREFRSAYDHLLRLGVVAEKAKSDRCGMLSPLSHITYPHGRAIAEAWIALSDRFQKK